MSSGAARRGGQVPEATVVFTVKLPAGAGRAGARACPRGRDHHLRRGGAGAGGIPGAGPQKPSPQVSGRAVEAEFVFGRHAAAELSVAYAILVPQRQARIARAGQEGRPPRDQRGDLRPGLQRPAEEGPDDRLADRGAARARRAARLEVPEEWVFEDEGHSGATLVRPALEALRDLAAQGLRGRGAVLLPGPAGPQVRLPGAADRGVRPGRGAGGVRQGPARRQPRKTSCWSSSRACSPSTRRPS